MTDKYEISDIQHSEHSFLRRIRALRDFADVKRGDLGGYVENVYNLSQSGTCWVYDNACMYGNAHMTDHACMSGNASMSGNARMSDNASMSGNACMYGNARMSDNASMTDHACMSGNVRMFDNARMTGNAHMSGNARMAGNARMTGNARMSGDGQLCGNSVATRSPNVLMGFPHTVTVTDHHVIVGCEYHPPSVWRNRGTAIIKADGHTAKQAKEWAAIINALADAHGCTDPEDKP